MSKSAASIRVFVGFAVRGSATVAVVLLASSTLASVSACKKNVETNAPAEAGVVEAGPPPLAKVVESCDMISAHGTCVDYTKSDLAIHRTLCEGFKGKFAEAACNLDNTVGGCVLADGEIKRYYNGVASKDSGFTVEFAKKNCESDLLRGRFIEVKK
ncbi:MAG: hypothetical protein U0174_20880 [Polyangiaceae bacterium]